MCSAQQAFPFRTRTAGSRICHDAAVTSRVLGQLLVAATVVLLAACTSSDSGSSAPEGVSSGRGAATLRPEPTPSFVPSSSEALRTTYMQVCVGVPDQESAAAEDLTARVAAAVQATGVVPSNVVSARACSAELTSPDTTTTLRIDFFGALDSAQLSRITDAATSAVPGSSAQGGSVPGTALRILVPHRGPLDLSAQADAIGSILSTFSSAPEQVAMSGLDYVGPPLTAAQIDEVAGLVAAAAGVGADAARLYPLPGPG